MATHEAQAYKDPGTPEEQSRRQFLATATVGIGNVIGLVLTVPLVTSLIPESLLKPGVGGGQWTPIAPADFKTMESAADTPIKISFSFKAQDGYFPPSDTTRSSCGA